MGAGKSYWGLRMGQLASLPFIDLDQAIEESTHKSISQLFEENGEEGFRQTESDRLHHWVESEKNLVMACGGGTPCFLNNMEYMKSKGTVVWLHPPIEILLNRISSEQKKRPLVSSLQGEQLRQFIINKMAERRIYYEQAHITVTEDSVDIPSLLKKIIHV